MRDWKVTVKRYPISADKKKALVRLVTDATRRVLLAKKQ